MVRILVVGAGVTGALCAHMIRRHLPTRLQCQIVVWEKSRGVGGRMSLSKATDIEDCSAELGAQYITQHSKYFESHKSYFDELLDSNVIQPFNGIIDGLCGDENSNFICTQGLSSIAKHYFSKSSVELCTNLRLESLRVISADSWNVWEASTTSGRHDHFDAVILTMPIPQILSIEGAKGQLNENQVGDLESAEYSSRFAIGLFYDKNVVKHIPYVAKYVKDSDIIRYIAIDQAKRGIERVTSSIVVHTSVPFGKRHLDEDAEIVGKQIINELNRIIPDLPEPNYVKYHKWRFSQVTQPTGTYGSLVVSSKPLLLFAGDGFTHSNFDGCIESATSIDDTIKLWTEKILQQ